MNILLITLNTLRFDELELLSVVKKFPFVIFKNVFTSGTSTPFAFPGIFNSVYFSFYTPRRSPSFVEILKSYGYKTFGHNGGNIYCSDVWGYEKGFDIFDQRFRGISISDLQNYSIPSCYDITQKFLRWIEKIGDESFFAWLHYMDIHGKWDHLTYLDDHERELAVILQNEKKKLVLNDTDLKQLKKLRKSIIKHINKNLDGILSYLSDRENLMVVITSDHGEELMEHGNVDHLPKPYDEIIHVPFAIYTTDGNLQKELREHVNDLVSLVDFSITLAGVLGIRANFGIGINFLRGKRNYVYSEGFRQQNGFRHDPTRQGARNFSVRTLSWKYMMLNGKEMLFDLTNDLQEQNPLVVEESVKKEVKTFINQENRKWLSWKAKCKF